MYIFAPIPRFDIVRMRHFLLTSIFLIQFYGIVHAQLPKDSRFLTELEGNPLWEVKHVSFEEEIRSFVQKTQGAHAENMIGVSLFESKKTSVVIPFVQIEETSVFLSKITLPTDRESHLLLSNYHLTRGEAIYIRSAAEDKIHGPYTIEDNVASGRFLAGPFRGDIYLEYHRSAQGDVLDSESVSFELGQIYLSPNRVANTLGFGAAFACQININCTEGQRYRDEKSGVMRIRMVSQEGIALCTGTLLNNTANDDTPYVLTAYHCLRPPSGALNTFFDMWRFDFNYESNSCANPETEPSPLSLRGAQLLAEWLDTDMMLVKILEELPLNQNFYFNGWNRDPNHLPAKSVIIHHPAGDIKKISTDNDRLKVHAQTIPWDNNTTSSANSHFINDFDDAVFQPGSSGCGLFDDRGFVIGQLHGGPLADNFCSIGIGYSGRLYVSWESGSSRVDRLKDWLDPLNTGVMSLSGRYKQETNQPVQFIGRVITSKGIAIPNVEVRVTGDMNAIFMTGSDGRFVLDNLSVNGNYSFSLHKDTNHASGLSVTDIITIRNHILGTNPIASLFDRLAADVNGDGNITATDIVLVRNLLVQRIMRFPAVPSWKFEPSILELSGSNIGSGGLELQIIGYKMGDANGSANPRN